MNDMAVDAADRQCRDMVGQDPRRENFPVGSRLIARHVRPHMHAYYSFARNADDIANSPDLAPEDKIARLDIMEEVLLGQAAGRLAQCHELRRVCMRRG